MASKFSIEKSNYLAAIVAYSGGLSPYGSYSVQNPLTQPAVLLFYGGPTDVTPTMDYSAATWYFRATFANQWPQSPIFVCNHNLGHAVNLDAVPSVWQFLENYYFEATPNPYQSGMPAFLPSYCQNTSQTPPVLTPDPVAGCQQGSFSVSNNSVCQYCPIGSYAPANSTSSQNCACVPGFSGSGGSSCVACPRDQYKSMNGTGSCTACPANTVSFGGATIYSCSCSSGYVGVDGGPCNGRPFFLFFFFFSFFFSSFFSSFFFFLFRCLIAFSF